MTRQKKEILKRIEIIQDGIDADIAMGCGCIPSNAFAKQEAEMDTLWEELAHLSHYNSAVEMFYDPRNQPGGQDLPW